MDISMRNELLKPGQDSRFLVDNQRHRADLIQKETEEYEQRAKFLKNKIKEIEDKIFNNQMGEKIKELVKENLNLSIDAQCLSIQLDIYNQGMDNRGVAGPEDASFYRNSPVHQGQGQHPMMHPMGSPMSPLNAINRSNTPTSSPNVVTLDTASYPYAQVVPPPNMSPYPVQGPIGYPMNGGRTHLSPHHEPARQMSPVHSGQLYSYDRHGSLSILNQVPPPAGGMSWMQHQGNYPMSPMSPSSSQMPPGPPVPPRPSDLPLRNRPSRSGLPTPPHRPVPPPPTPPKPNSKSPNLERPRSSNDVLDSREELVNARRWQCTHCTFENHEAINECEMCGNSRQGSVATLNRSPH